VKVEVDRLTIKFEVRGGDQVNTKSRWIDNRSKVEDSRPGKVEAEGLGGSTW
jgi:hypothetical protein